MKELPCAGKEASPTRVRLKAEVTDSDEATGQGVKQESPDEVWGRKSERSAQVATPAIAVEKRHLTAFVCNEAFVADGDAMGVAAEVAKHLCRTRHGGLAVDDPFLGGCLSEQTASEVGSDAGRFLLQRLVQEIEQLPPEHLGEDSHWDEKARRCGDPVITRGVQATARDDAVDVGVEEEGLGPGVEHGDRAWCRSEPSLADSVERPDRRLEEQRVACPPVGQEERVECDGRREDQVKVGHREKLALLSLDPACLLQVLALGASVDTSKPATTWTGKTGHHRDSGRDSLMFTS